MCRSKKGFDRSQLPLYQNFKKRFTQLKLKELVFIRRRKSLYANKLLCMGNAFSGPGAAFVTVTKSRCPLQKHSLYQGSTNQIARHPGQVTNKQKSVRGLSAFFWLGKCHKSTIHKMHLICQCLYSQT